MAFFRQRNLPKFLTTTLLQNMERDELGRKFSRRWYDGNNNSRDDWNKLRPMIKKRILNRAKLYPIKAMIPVAQEVLQARAALIDGVSSLLKAVPAVSCKNCSEVYIGEAGHQIKTCGGYKSPFNEFHKWIRASLNDILVPVESFHLDNMYQDVIEHHQRFDFDRVPAVVELCWQAGVPPRDLDLQSPNSLSDEGDSLSTDEMRIVAQRTLSAWEILREGVEKLLVVYPAKVCEHCSEVHVGPSGHKARLCGVFKYQSWRGGHFWKKAGVDDLVPPKIVWYRRPQDPPVLLDSGRNYYGHAPAVVDLCTKAGVPPPAKYTCLMKAEGLPAPSSDKLSV